MKVLIFTLFIFVAITSTVFGAENQISYADLITAAALPPGYKITSQDIMIDGEKRGTAILVSKNGSSARTIITVENRQLPTKAHRLAAFAGYVNASAHAIVREGFHPVGKIFIDRKELEKLDFVEPVTVSLTYEDKDGAPLYQEIRGVFTQIGYSIVTIARNKDDLQLLSKWAQTVKGNTSKTSS